MDFSGYVGHACYSFGLLLVGLGLRLGLDFMFVILFLFYVVCLNIVINVICVHDTCCRCTVPGVRKGSLGLEEGREQFLRWSRQPVMFGNPKTRIQ